MSGEWAHASFDDIGVKLDATVVEQTGEPVPVVQGIADVFGDRRLGGDARELLLKPGFKRQHQRPALFLPHRAAIGTGLGEQRLPIGNDLEKAGQQAAWAFRWRTCRKAPGDGRQNSLWRFHVSSAGSVVQSRWRQWRAKAD